MTSTGFQLPVAMNEMAPIPAIMAWVAGSATSCARNMLRLRSRKLRVPVRVWTKRVRFGMSMAMVDQKLMFAMNSTISEACPSARKVQMFSPLVSAMPPG